MVKKTLKKNPIDFLAYRDFERLHDEDAPEYQIRNWYKEFNQYERRSYERFLNEKEETLSASEIMKRTRTEPFYINEYLDDNDEESNVIQLRDQKQRRGKHDDLLDDHVLFGIYKLLTS